MVICNPHQEQAICVAPILENGDLLSQYRLVDEEKLHDFQRFVTIPPRSAAVII